MSLGNILKRCVLSTGYSTVNDTSMASFLLITINVRVHIHQRRRKLKLNSGIDNSCKGSYLYYVSSIYLQDCEIFTQWGGGGGSGDKIFAAPGFEPAQTAGLNPSAGGPIHSAQPPDH